MEDKMVEQIKSHLEALNALARANKILDEKLTKIRASSWRLLLDELGVDHV